GLALAEALAHPDRTPQRLSAQFRAWRSPPPLVGDAPPTLIVAAFGRARITGQLTPHEEDRLLASLITHWALASTLDIAALCAGTPPSPALLPPPHRRPQPLPLAGPVRIAS